MTASGKMLTPDPLSGCDLKLRRALKHMNALEDLASTWLAEHPIPFDTGIDDVTGEKFWWVTEDVDHPPDDWSFVFGEFLYALRSALDHLAGQLVIRAGDEPDTRTEFPIFKDPARYESNAPRKIRGMTQPMIEAIKGVQPCFRPNPPAMPLWWLQDLCNIDKHRVLHVIAAAMTGGGTYTPVPSTDLLHPFLGPIERGSELLRVPPEYVKLDWVPFFGIELEIDWPPYRRQVAFLISELYSASAGIVSSFQASFF